MKRVTVNKKFLPRKVASLFAGIGGFELAFQQKGIPTSLVCEIDPIAQHILQTNIPDAKLSTDICDLARLPRGVNVVCAGFPCQDLSTIGIKTGLAGSRSSLIKEVFRLLRQSKVEWVIIENVTNMLHLNNGETIKTIVEELESLGYNWAYRTIDSIAFVPQHRCRVYVVASLHCDPRNVILSGDTRQEQGIITSTGFTEACGFYWTEGKYAIGLYQNSIPTLKCGSTIGIASPPAIAFPNGEVSCPDIRDAERLQGFPVDWTKPAEDVTKASLRWKLVGNAVTVDTVSWIVNKIFHPEFYDSSKDKSLGKKWPSAAWGINGERHSSSVSQFPVEREEIPLRDYLHYPCRPLSLKAAKGFEERLNTGTVRCPQFFKDAIRNYIESISK